MTTKLRVALLATAIILTPAAAGAGTLIDARSSSSASAATASAPSSDEASLSSALASSPIHWALIATGAIFLGTALYIQRRRGFDLD